MPCEKIEAAKSEPYDADVAKHSILCAKMERLHIGLLFVSCCLRFFVFFASHAENKKNVFIREEKNQLVIFMRFC